MDRVGPHDAHVPAELDESDDSTRDSTQGGGGSLVVWMLASLFCVAVLALAVSHAPARIRLIGLLSIGFGLLVGWLIVWLANVFEVRPSLWTLFVFAASLACGGFVLSTLQTFQLDTAMRQLSKEEELAAKLMREIDRQRGVVKADETVVQRFREFLSRRVRQLGAWPSPWPEVFWSGESLLTGIAAGGLSVRRASASSRSQPE